MCVCTVCRACAHITMHVCVCVLCVGHVYTPLCMYVCVCTVCRACAHTTMHVCVCVLCVGHVYTYVDIDFVTGHCQYF